MNIKDPWHVLDEISREQIPQDLDLLPGTLAKIQQGKRACVKTATKRYFAAFLLVILLLITFFSQPGVASALKKLIGYIPQVGAVDQSAPLRVLANPVTDTRDGFTITVESALLDSTHTVLNYQISGQFPSWDDPSLKPRMCQESPMLRLADGKELAYPAATGGFGGGKSQWQNVFPAIPAAENRASLVLPCLPELPAGEGPQDWEIPLAFSPAPPELTVYPVVEMPTPSPAKPEGATPANGMQVAIQGIAALEDGYYLQAVLSWRKDPAVYEVQIYPDSVHLFDATGQEVSAWPADLDPPFASAENQSMKLNLQTAPILAPGPARLVVDYVGLGMFASTHFSIDVGDDLQPGQTWQLNKDLEVNGHRLRVLSAEYIQASPGEPAMLMVYLESDADVLAITAMDREHEILDTGGSPNNGYVPFRVGWHYKDGFPRGNITVEITTITIRRSGPWSVDWTLPAPAATPTVQVSALPQEPAICSSDMIWQAALSDLPAGLGGRVASSVWTGERHDLFVSNLDGSNLVPLEYGAFPDLSPDGQRVVYRGPEDGLHVRDLAGGGDLLIPGTIHEQVFDNWPKWSPDGQLIAFDRVTGHTSDIYLVNPDGSNLHPVVNGPEDERFLGWAPDGRQISYTVTEQDGQIIRVFDLQTGKSFEAGRLPPDAMNAGLSADGKRLLYMNEQGMFLVTMDNSSPSLLIANTPTFGKQIRPIWSPDSQWIAMTFWESAAGSEASLALLQPDTCQMVLLREQKFDWLSSWVP